MTQQRTYQDGHRFMAPLMEFARVMDYLDNPDPEAVFEANNACVSLSASATVHPADPLLEQAMKTDLFIAGSGVKKCAYIGAVYWLWDEDAYGPFITGFRVETDPYILNDAADKGKIPAAMKAYEEDKLRLLSKRAAWPWYKNRSCDIAWVIDRFLWLWKHSDMPGNAPPANLGFYVAKKDTFYQDREDGVWDLLRLEPVRETKTLAGAIEGTGDLSQQAAETPADGKKLTVYDLLRTRFKGVHLTMGANSAAQMYLHEDAHENTVWIVFCKSPASGKTRTIYKGTDESEAARIFAQANGIELD